MKRSAAYLALSLVGFLGGAIVGIRARNCSHPDQPPFLECVAEDLSEPLIFGVVFALLALTLVGTVDLARTAYKAGSEASLPAWRKWLYVILLVAVAVPALLIVVQQSDGRFSSDGQIVVLFVGTWILTAPILVDFIVWLFRNFDGIRRLIPVSVVVVIAVVAYFLASDPDFGCTRQASDSVSCYTAMEIYVSHYVALAAMVTWFFLKARRSGDVSGSDVGTASLQRRD